MNGNGAATGDCRAPDCPPDAGRAMAASARKRARAAFAYCGFASFGFATTVRLSYVRCGKAAGEGRNPE